MTSIPKRLYLDLRTNRGRQSIHAVSWRSKRAVRQAARLIALGRTEGQVYPTAFSTVGEEVMDQLRTNLTARAGGYMEGGSTCPQTRIVHVAAEDVGEMLQDLLDHAAAEILIDEGDGRPRPLSAASRQRIIRLALPFSLLVVERTIAGDEIHRQCSKIEIATWTRSTGAYSRPFYEADRQFALARRLRPSTFERLLEEGHNFDSDFPAPGRPGFDIDVVYTWVDGSDPEWLEQKHRFSSGTETAATIAERVVHQERFHNRDELKYSLRSLELFGSWVRRIFIVTAGQCPAWLDTDHPKITLVDHADIYRDPTWLPTFNSSGIETQLHHIDGLADRFLYFNDDFFLGRLTEPGDFFCSNGAIRYFESPQRAYEGDIDSDSEEYVQADKRAIDLFSKQFAEVGRSIMLHAPYASDRSLLYEMEERFSNEFAECAASRFRSSHDLRPIAFMQYHFGYPSLRAVPSRVSNRYLALWKPDIEEQLSSLRQRRGYQTFCINDVGLQAERKATIDAAVDQFLDSYFPAASSFER